MRIILAGLIIGLLGALTAHCEPANAGPSVSPGAAVIQGPIQGNNLATIQTALLKSKSGSTFDIVINSPGGSVATGFRFISIMEDAKARGVTIQCFVPGMAASMAFQILLHCNQRHVLNRSGLLWHRARVMMGGLFGAPLTAPQLSVIADSLGSIDALIFEETLDLVGMSERETSYHFENETMHVGEQLAAKVPGAFRSHVAIPGVFEALLNPKAPRSDAAGGGGDEEDMSGFRFGELIYITHRRQ